MRFANVRVLVCMAVSFLVCPCLQGELLDIAEGSGTGRGVSEGTEPFFIDHPEGYSFGFSPSGGLGGVLEMTDGRIWFDMYPDSGSERVLFAYSDAGWELISTPDWLGSPFIICQDALGQTWLYWQTDEEQWLFGVIDDRGEIGTTWEYDSSWGTYYSETSDNRLVFIGSGEVTAVDCATFEVERYTFDCGETLAMAPDDTVWCWLGFKNLLGLWDWSECHDFPNLTFPWAHLMHTPSLTFGENGDAWVAYSVDIGYFGLLYHYTPAVALRSIGSAMDWDHPIDGEIGYCSQLEVGGVFWSSCGNMNVGKNYGLVRASYEPDLDVSGYFRYSEYAYQFLIDRKGRKLGVSRKRGDGVLRLWMIDDGGMPQSHVSLGLSEESDEIVARFANVGKRRRLWYVIAAQAGSELLYWPGWGSDPVWGSINVGAGETKTVSISDRDELPFAGGQPVRLYAVISLSSNLQAVIGRPGEEISTLYVDETRSDTEESRLPISLAEPVLGPAR